MRPSLSPNAETGETVLSGRLTCPRPACGANIGKFAWQGQKCTCGEWVVPGLSLIRGKVDEMRKAGVVGDRGQGSQQTQRDPRLALGIRMPPGFTPNNTGSGRGNL